MRQPTFLEFTESCIGARFTRSAWIKEPGLRIYVRKSYRPTHGDFELANISATTPGKGALTRFLDTYEPDYRFYVENILEPRLIGFLTRRGYSIIAPDMGPRHAIGPAI